MKINIFKILLLGGFCFSSPSLLASKPILADKMIFKISDSVFSLSDLESTYTYVNDLKCIYDDSLLVRIFDTQFEANNKIFYKYKKKLTNEDRLYFSSLINFSKLLIYSKSQNVVLDPNIPKYFYISAKKNKCSVNGFQNAKELTKDFELIVKLEIFVRTRFLPTEKAGQSTKEDLAKAISTSRNLLKSISKQIEEEVYW